MKERLPENYLLEMKELLKNLRDYAITCGQSGD